MAGASNEDFFGARDDCLILSACLNVKNFAERNFLESLLLPDDDVLPAWKNAPECGEKICGLHGLDEVLARVKLPCVESISAG